MNDTLKVAGRIGAELGAAKAEVERLRGLLEELHPYVRGCSSELWDRYHATLSQQAEPTDAYTATDMINQSAQAFRDGQAAVEPTPAQDEQQPALPVDSEAWLQEWARGKFTYTGAYKPRVLGQLYGNTDWALARALHSAIVSQLHAPIAQTAPQSEQINIDPLLNAGAALSNIAFNLAQRPGVTLDQHVCDLLSSARKRWDAARAALSAQGQSNGDS